MRIGIDDILAGHGIGTGSAGGGGGRLVAKTERVTNAIATSSVSVPVGLAFDKTKDMLMVFQNSVYMHPGADYTLDANGTTITNPSANWQAQTTFDFLVVTNTKESLPTYDGSLIADGTVTEAKLSQAIRDKVNASGDFAVILGKVAEVEQKTRAMREIAANAQLQMEATDLVASGSTFGGNGTFAFGSVPDLAKTTTTNILDAGTTVLTGKVASHNVFKIGQEVTIYDDTNSEHVVVTKVGASELEVSALSNQYKSGAVICRSSVLPLASNGGYDFPKWNSVALKKGVVRFALGTTDEAVLWGTKDQSVTSSVKAKFGAGVEAAILGVDKTAEEKLAIKSLLTKTPVDLAKTDNSTEGWSKTDVGYGFGITVDTSGNVYCAHNAVGGGKAIRKLDANGNELWSKTDVESGYGIAVDMSGNVYCAHNVNGGSKAIRKLDANGNELWSKTDVANGRGIAVDASGNVYCTHAVATGSKAIRKLDANGNELWSKTDVANGYGIAVDASGNVYCALSVATGSKAIRKLDANGNELWSKTDVGYGYGIAVDASGNVYCAHYVAAGDKAIRKLDANGNELWSKTDVANGYSIAVDASGNVYCTHFVSSGKAIRKLDANGNELWSKTDVGNGFGIAVDASGNVYCAHNVSAGNKAIRKFDASANELWSKADIAQGYDIAVDASGNVYCAYYVGTGGKATRKLDANGNELWSKTDVSNGYGIAVDASGNVYCAHTVAAGGKAIRKLDANGNELWSKTDVPSGYSIAVDASGNVYCAHAVAAGDKAIRKLDANGNELWSKTDVANGYDIAVDASGNVYCAHGVASGKVIRKIGFAYKTKDWSAPTSAQNVSITGRSGAATFRVNGTTKKVVTLDKATVYEFPLVADDYAQGANTLRVTFEDGAYEEWQVTRDGKRLVVSQYVASNTDAQPLELKLELEKATGATEGKLHKYLGAIG